MSDASPKSFWPTLLAIIGVFAIFLLIMRVAQTPVQPLRPLGSELAEEDQWRLSDEGRQSRLVELRGREAAALKGYGWVDQSAGVIRLPLEQAMELVIAEANANR